MDKDSSQLNKIYLNINIQFLVIIMQGCDVKHYYTFKLIYQRWQPLFYYVLGLFLLKLENNFFVSLLTCLGY